MTGLTIKDVIDHIIDIEGGYVDDPDDSGGETNWGITEPVAREYGYKGQMKNLSREMAFDIYKALYWEDPRYDDVAIVSEKVARKLFDIGVNAGVHRASVSFQRVLNVFNNRGTYYPDLVVDGKIGPKTLDTFSAFFARRGNHGLEVFHESLTCLQGAFYIGLAEAREKDEKFVYGWISNRVM